MEWTDDNCLALIEFYKKQPALWNPNHQRFGFKKAKRDAWIEIGKNMNLPPGVCKNKMKILLSGLRREKAKLRQSQMYLGKGAPGTGLYRSQWFAFQAFTFLLHRDKPSTEYDAVVKIEPYDIDVANEPILIEEPSTTNEPVILKQPTTTTIFNEPTIARQPPIAVQPSVGSTTTSESRLHKSDSDANLSIMKDSLAILKSVTSKANDDEISSFCKFIQHKLRNYDNLTKNMVQKELCEVIFKADSGQFTPKPTEATATES